MKCPYCGEKERTFPLVKITELIIEWICDVCGCTWNEVKK